MKVGKCPIPKKTKNSWWYYRKCSKHVQRQRPFSNTRDQELFKLLIMWLVSPLCHIVIRGDSPYSEWPRLSCFGGSCGCPLLVFPSGPPSSARGRQTTSPPRTWSRCWLNAGRWLSLSQDRAHRLLNLNYYLITQELFSFTSRKVVLPSFKSLVFIATANYKTALSFAFVEILFAARTKNSHCGCFGQNFYLMFTLRGHVPEGILKQKTEDWNLCNSSK